jgi:formate dehydrogenase (NADP+) beta subunit
MESRDEQTADEFEIEDGIEEGITLINRVGPVSVERDDQGKISGVKVRKLKYLFDHNKRFAPNFVDHSEYIIPCDSVALAVGQQMDMSLFDEWDKKESLILDRGIIRTEAGTGRTSVPGIYCGGDAGFGPALFITAIRHGQEAARAIDKDLLGTKPYLEYVGEFTTIPPARDKEYLKTSWSLPTLQSPDTRGSNLNIVENNYTDQEAHQQSSRCLQCHTSPVFDGHLCIKCNGCVDVCPTNCLTLIPLSHLNMMGEDEKIKKVVENFYGIDLNALSDDELDNLGSAMLKDEDLCIRCGLCAEKCPTQAVTMDVMNYSFRWVG